MEFPIIQRPKRKSEFEFQAELFFALKNSGYEVYGEVPGRFNGRGCSFDLVVFNHAGAFAIIEVKNTAHEAVVNGKQTQQIKKYKAYDLPVLLYTSIVPMQKVLDEVRRLAKSHY